MKISIKRLLSLVVVFSFCFSMFAMTPVFAQLGDTGDASGLFWDGQDDDIRTNTGLGDEDPQIIAANIINVILGFLGILAVVLILFGGFKWMTAAGNEDKVAEAKKLLVAGVIGLIIVLAAFALASFVLEALFDVTGAGS